MNTKPHTPKTTPLSTRRRTLTWGIIPALLASLFAFSSTSKAIVLQTMDFETTTTTPTWVAGTWSTNWNSWAANSWCELQNLQFGGNAGSKLMMVHGTGKRPTLNSVARRGAYSMAFANASGNGITTGVLPGGTISYVNHAVDSRDRSEMIFQSRTVQPGVTYWMGFAINIGGSSSYDATYVAPNGQWNTIWQLHSNHGHPITLCTSSNGTPVGWRNSDTEFLITAESYLVDERYASWIFANTIKSPLKARDGTDFWFKKAKWYDFAIKIRLMTTGDNNVEIWVRDPLAANTTPWLAHFNAGKVGEIAGSAYQNGSYYSVQFGSYRSPNLGVNAADGSTVTTRNRNHHLNYDEIRWGDSAESKTSILPLLP